jgi:hypothetical protein
MAYVAISNELIDNVRGEIRGMARKELDTIGPLPKLQGTESFIEQHLWGNLVHLKGQMPSQWKKHCSQVILRIHFPDGAVWQDHVTLATPAEAPPDYDFYKTPKVSFQHDDPSIAHIVTQIGNRNDAQKRWQAVESQVLDFLRKCKSLNEGLKLWPDLRMYIHPHYLERVERKVERSTASSGAAEVLKSIDTNQIVAAAVIARMSTGGGEET